MAEKIKSTYERFMDSLSPREKKDFDEEYKDFLVSEMVLAALEGDDISVRKLAKLAGVSPTIVQELRSGAKKDINMKSFFKILVKGLGCKILIERNGHITPLDLAGATGARRI